MVSLIQNVMEFLGTINGQHTVVFRREFRNINIAITGCCSCVQSTAITDLIKFIGEN